MNAPLTPAQRAALESVHLDDKYTLTAGRAWMSGIHALVRLPMMQRVRDERAGLNTAGFVSGYRGSPLGGVDQNMWKAAKYLKQHHIEFQPGINEDLAATAVWGSQQVNLFPGAKYDGVFGMWYGKGPGVDRCGDVFKHANVAGTSRHGGVLVVAGDDHPAKSSTLPHQSDHILKVCMIPALFPASVQEVLDYGLHGWAMSRYAGVWVGMKCITDIVEVSASVEVDPERTRIVLPEDFQLPPDGLNIRLPDTPLQQEARLLDYKLYAALAYARANRLNREMWQVPNAQARFGIMTSGKAYLDTRQALADLGLSEEICKRIGLRLFKVGMVWPLEATGMQRFAEDLDEILVVEEKRQVLEYQLKEELFSWIGTGKKIPRVVGKFDDKDGGEWSVPQGNWLLPAHYEFSPAMVAKAIGARLLRFELPEDVRAGIQARLDFIAEREQALARPRLVVDRKPWFCSGCPHNTSTRVPEGSRGMAGIGCHYMVTWMGRNTQVFTQMGGEGVPWVGQAPFTEEKHVFANLGDCTYYHSGLLAIRAAVAAKVPITYKILFNDAVAMTSGQPVDGPISVPMITRQMAAEGIEKIVVVTDEPEKYRHVTDLAPGVPVKHRDELDAVMKELRAYPDVSVLVYDQTCATEKRRRRKRNAYPDPALRVVINERVCEGCGDCSEKSHCLSVEPLETEFGRKRTINQSSCNKDYSCLKGFCPSFVTVEGGRLRKPRALAQQDAIDQGGPAGAARRRAGRPLRRVHRRRGRHRRGHHRPVAGHGRAPGRQGLFGAGHGGPGPERGRRVLARRAGPHAGRTAQYASGHGRGRPGAGRRPGRGHQPRGHRPHAPGPHAYAAQQRRRAHGRLRPRSRLDPARLQPAGRPGQGVRGGQRGHHRRGRAGGRPAGRRDLRQSADDGLCLPEGLAAAGRGRDAARHRTQRPAGREQPGRVRLGGGGRNGWSGWAGVRRPPHDLAQVQALIGKGQPAAGDEGIVEVKRGQGAVVDFKRPAGELGALARIRRAFLAQYQNEAYARRYQDLVDQVAAAEQAATGTTRLAEAVARYYFKLMAYKDEYEVARLYSDGEFLKRIDAQFEGDWKLNFHLAPPLFSKRDSEGHLVKRRYGPATLRLFGALARLRFLRGTAFDVFGYTAERRAERALIEQYREQLGAILPKLNRGNLEHAVALASLPEEIRGYGHIKEAAMARADVRRAELMREFSASVVPIGGGVRAA